MLCALPVDPAEPPRGVAPRFPSPFDRKSATEEPGDRLRSILVCEDEAPVRAALVDHLVSSGYAAVGCADGEEALTVYATHMPDAVLLDLRLPTMDGLDVLRRLRASEPELPVIVVTAVSTIDSAVAATRLGASAYLVKPFDASELSVQLARLLGEHDRNATAKKESGGAAVVEDYGGFVLNTTSMKRLAETLAAIERVKNPTVLITGETGTGKDLLAQAIHKRGMRGDKPFQAVDCASLPSHLVESELFGHERGSFTDAHVVKRGLFEVARDGVIFLDEIGEMLPAMQAKLLRALETRSFRRVGGVVDLPLEAAIVAATNRNLQAEVQSGAFREDLFFRLNVIPVTIPPLRQRSSDIEPIAVHLVRRLSAELDRDIDGITPGAVDLLRRRRWPGNVRELKNALHRAIIMKVGGGAVTADDLPADVADVADVVDGSGVAGYVPRTGFVLPDDGVDLADVERDLLMQALARARGNLTHAGKLLRITRFALRYRLQKHGLAPHSQQPGRGGTPPPQTH